MLTNFMIDDVCGGRDKRFDSVGQVVRLFPALQSKGGEAQRGFWPAVPGAMLGLMVSLNEKMVCASISLRPM